MKHLYRIQSRHTFLSEGHTYKFLRQNFLIEYAKRHLLADQLKEKELSEFFVGVYIINNNRLNVE